MKLVNHFKPAIISSLKPNTLAYFEFNNELCLGFFGSISEADNTIRHGIRFRSPLDGDEAPPVLSYNVSVENNGQAFVVDDYEVRFDPLSLKCPSRAFAPYGSAVVGGPYIPLVNPDKGTGAYLSYSLTDGKIRTGGYVAYPFYTKWEIVVPDGPRSEHVIQSVVAKAP